MTIKEQFERYLENQFTNPCIEESEKLPFDSCESVEESGIGWAATSGCKKYYFESNCYFITDEGIPLHEFELVTGERLIKEFFSSAL